MRDGRILHANEQYHDWEAVTYDEGHPYMRNAFAQNMFQADIRAIADTLAPFHSPIHILDCGAGTGNLSMKFLEAGAHVTAVDISRNMLDRLSLKAARLGKGALETVHSDIDSFLETTTGRYDVICSSSFLHHLPDYQATYRAMANLASDESILYTAFEPRPQTELSTVQKLFTKTDSAVAEILSRRLYNPFIVARAILRRLRLLPTPAQALSQVDVSFVERPDLGVDAECLSAILRTVGFNHISICWRPVSRYTITYVLNKNFVHLNNALFMVSQRSVSKTQRVLTVTSSGTLAASPHS